ncbi:MAG TPA: hypothetical protein ENL20_03995 [Candidatus Cloacimonetes bacterium]|nr:hypothetical protein [Candidatus Cloacimonadota bacterium]
MIIEFKTADPITQVHKAQPLNCLDSTNFKLGIPVNFPSNKVEGERIPNQINERV